MLNNIHPLLGPELLYALHRMGHGDEIALVDAHFPATSCARRLVRMPGVPATAALEAIMSVFPLDTYVACPVSTMEVVRGPAAVPDVVLSLREIVARNSPGEIAFAALAREAFYTRSRSAFAIVATGEQRAYGKHVADEGRGKPVTSGVPRVGLLGCGVIAQRTLPG